MKKIEGINDYFAGKRVTYEVNYIADNERTLTDDEYKLKNREITKIILLLIFSVLVLFPLLLYLYNWSIMR